MAPVMPRQDSRARAERAAQLRAMGRTWAEISASLGYQSRGAAQRAVSRLHDRTPPEGIESLRRHEAEELRLRRAVLYERFFDAKRRADDDALVTLNRELDRIAARTAKLHGLDAPERAEVQVTHSADPAAILADARTRLLEIVDAEVVEPKELTR